MSITRVGRGPWSVDRGLNIKLELKHGIMPPQLHRIDRYNGKVIISLDELRTADAQLAMPRLDLMVLHPPALIGGG